MSDLRVGLVVEGPTDALVLAAGLKAFLNIPFIPVTLQPETPPTKTGTGWGGVFWWCRQVSVPGYETLAENPVLEHLDLIIIQVDADVAQIGYNAANITNPPRIDLPCEYPCPPASDTVAELYDVVCGWLAPSRPGDKAVICIPSKCIEAWVAAALYGLGDPERMSNLECDYGVEAYLHDRPARERLIRMRNGRFRKIKDKYHKAQPIISGQWHIVTRHCPQAAMFQSNIENLATLLNTGG